MPLTAVRHIRKMRGGAQSHLLEADDGHCYVVKFRNNPQHRRILVNELVASVFLRLPANLPPRNGVCCASPPDSWPPIPRSISPSARAASTSNPAGTSARAIPAIRPAPPFTISCPMRCCRTVVNLDDFRAILVFDKWAAMPMAASASSTAPACRRTRRDALPGFVARMIDHGFVFNGPHWDFPDSPLQGLYARRPSTTASGRWTTFSPGSTRCAHFPEEVMDQAWKQHSSGLDRRRGGSSRTPAGAAFERRKRRSGTDRSLPVDAH